MKPKQSYNLLFVNKNGWKDDQIVKIFPEHSNMSYGLYQESYVNEPFIFHIVSWADYVISINKEITDRMCFMSAWKPKFITLDIDDSLGNIINTIQLHEKLKFLKE